MKAVYILRKQVFVVILGFIVLCVAGCRKPTPEQVAMQTGLLYEAIEDDNLKQANECIKAGADVNAKDDKGNSALKSAINWKCIQLKMGTFPLDSKNVSVWKLKRSRLSIGTFLGIKSAENPPETSPRGLFVAKKIFFVKKN